MESKQWNNIIQKLPDPHILQTWEWGRVKADFGWKPFYKSWGNPENPDAAALILERSISFAGYINGLRVLYVPKGPLIRDWHDRGLVMEILDDLRGIARDRSAIFIKIDPDVPLGIGIPGTQDERVDLVGEKTIHLAKFMGYLYSREQIQFRNTVLLDLKPAEGEILAGMKQKTRYNVRLAGRRGVTIRTGTVKDFDLLYRMYAETSIRDGFAIRDEKYYHTLWGSFIDDGKDGLDSPEKPVCEALIAEVEGKAAAALVVFRFAHKAYYMHGMSLQVHREKMPNYLLQWEAIRRAKAAGCTVYDLWGAPEIFSEDDSMWGVYRFKEGLGGKVFRTIGAYDFPVKPLTYRLYTQTLPKLLEIFRRIGKGRVEKNLLDDDN